MVDVFEEAVVCAVAAFAVVSTVVELLVVDANILAVFGQMK